VVTGTERRRARISSPSIDRKFSLRLRSEITFHELPPAFSDTPTVVVALVNSR
jgi:hypothetical protein